MTRRAMPPASGNEMPRLSFRPRIPAWILARILARILAVFANPFPRLGSTYRQTGSRSVYEQSKFEPDGFILRLGNCLNPVEINLWPDSINSEITSNSPRILRDFAAIICIIVN